MAKCLVTTLQESATGTDLKKAGEVRIRVKGDSSVPLNMRTLTMTFLQPTTVTTTGEGRFVDSSQQTIGSSMQFTTNVAKTVYLSNPGEGKEYDLIIPNKYALAQLSFVEGLESTKSFFYIDVEDLAYATALSRITSSSQSISGSFQHVDGLNSLTYINIARGSFECDIADLAKYTSLQTLGLSYTGAYGDLADLAPLSRLTSLAIIGCAGIHGDLEVLENFPLLKYFNGPQLAGASLEGSIESVAECPLLIQFFLGSEYNVEGNISAFASTPNLTSLSISNANIEGDLDSLSDLSHLGSVTLSGCQKIQGSISAFANSAASMTSLYMTNAMQVSGDLSSLQNHTSLIALFLDGTAVEGDIGSLSGCTSLMQLALTNDYDVDGDIGDLAGCVGLQQLLISNTQVSGSIDDLSSLTALTSVNIAGTGVSGSLNVGLANCTNLVSVYADRCANLGGDLSLMPPNCSFVQAPGAGQFTWDSDRPASSCIIGMSGVNLGSDVDAMLIDQAGCAVPATTNSLAFAIRVNGTRTSASNSAVATLNSKGYGVYVNNALVIV